MIPTIFSTVGAVGIGSSAVLGIGLLMLWFFHYQFNGFIGNFEEESFSGYALNKPLFPQPLNMILRFILRLLDKFAYGFEVCGFVMLKEKIDDYGLSLFMFVFRRFHGDILDYDDTVPMPNL